MIEFTKKIQAQFDKMCSTGKLFRSSITGQKVWDIYINGFEPRDFIDRKQKVAAGIANSAEIAVLAESVFEAPAEADIEAVQDAVEARKAAELCKVQGNQPN